MDAIDPTVAQPGSSPSEVSPSSLQPASAAPRAPWFKAISASTIHTVAVVASGVWLVACLAIGILVMVPAGDDFNTIQTLTRAEAELDTRSHRSAYGGDAYTGIQNAASDTEAAVVEGANRTAERLANIEESVVAGTNALGAQLVSSTQQTNMIRLGLGAIVISVGALPLAIVTRKP